MLPHTLLAPALEYIFAKMTTTYNCTLGAWQRSFLGELFHVVFAMRGRAGFTNMARYSALCEQTFRRHFQRVFACVSFNLVIVRLRRHVREPLIGVFDCSFLPKSAEKTYGLDRFFSSAAGRSRRGLEVSLLGVVATKSRRAFGAPSDSMPHRRLPISRPWATRSTLGLTSTSSRSQDLYDRLAELGVSYWAGDGSYAKQKIFDAVTGAGGHLITRLRSDSNLRYLYTGPQKEGPGAPKQYDGKIDWSDQETLLRRFDEGARLPDKPQVRVLTRVANSPHFGRDLRIVLLVDPSAERYVVLGSTDTTQPAEQIAEYYRLRYQIEFVIRDAKQHTGLVHCQARSQEKMDFHLNMSVAAVNLLRLLAQKAGCSRWTYRREAYNRLLVDHLFFQLGLHADYEVMDPRLHPVLQTGRMAA